MANALTQGIDRGIEALLHLSPRVGPFDGFHAPLASFRQARAWSIAARRRPDIEALTDAVLEHDATAAARFDAIAAEAMAELRAARPSDWRYLLAAADRVLYRDIPERMDDPTLPIAERTGTLHTLDRFNQHLGSYDAWADFLGRDVEAAERGGRSPVKIHDLAAGHGGFALFLQQRWGDRVQMIASDVADEYLDLGRQVAEGSGVPVSFVHQDATALGNLSDAGVDIFLCTQSAHHFSPGMVARMLGEAARVARTAVCFIDGERNPLPLMLATTVMALYGRSYTAIHDTVASLRRMYLAEELFMLALMAPRMPQSATIDYGRLPPGHGYIRIAQAA